VTQARNRDGPANRHVTPAGRAFVAAGDEENLLGHPRSYEKSATPFADSSSPPITPSEGATSPRGAAGRLGGSKPSRTSRTGKEVKEHVYETE
jgi:hypothetical protein